MQKGLVQLAADIVTLCAQYGTDDKGLKIGIVRLSTQIQQLQKALEEAQETSSAIPENTIQDVMLLVAPLEDRLRNAESFLSVTPFGLRYFPWPLDREDVERIIKQAETLRMAILVDSPTAKLQQLQINDHQENVEEPLDDKSSLELCLSTMSQSLKQDICDLRKPDAVLGEVGPERILKATPEELRYACRRWSDHLQAEMNDASLDKIEEFLNKHVLHWIEAMTLIGSISKCIRTLRQLHSTVSTHHSHRQTLSTFLYDCWRFILRNRSIIEIAPLQTYSALLFSPQNSILRKSETWHQDLPAWLSLGESMLADWGPALLSLQGHSRPVSSTAFSPDGKWIASGSYDRTVRIWDASTGVLDKVLVGPTTAIDEVAFLDARRVACKVILSHEYLAWDIDTGKLQDSQLSREEEEMLKKRATIISPDGSLYLEHIQSHSRFIAKTDGPNALYMKNSHSGEIFSTLVHGSDTHAGAFSPDNKLIVTDGSHNTIHLWDATVENSKRTYWSHSDHVFHVASSANSGLIASASKDKTVVLWDAVKRRAQHVLRAEDMKAVWIVEFSPDGKSIATGSEDSTVRLWDTASGALIRSFTGHSRGIWALTFSEDGSQLASASIDNTVIVWNAVTGDKIEQFETEVVKDDADSNPRISYNDDFDSVLKLGVLFDGTTSYALFDLQRLRLWNRKDWKESKMIQFTGGAVSSRVSHKQRSVSSKQGVLLYQAPPAPGPLYSTAPSDLKLDDGWVSWKISRSLKLPEGNIPSSTAGKDNVLALGYEDGEVRFITIKPEEVHIETWQ